MDLQKYVYIFSLLISIAEYNFHVFYFALFRQLSTLMFWTEVFVTEWNYRKVSVLNDLRKATIDTMPNDQCTK